MDQRNNFGVNNHMYSIDSIPISQPEWQRRINGYYKNPDWHHSEIYSLDDYLDRDDLTPEKREQAIQRLIVMYHHTNRKIAKDLAGRTLTKHGFEGYEYSTKRLFMDEHKKVIRIVGTIALAILVYYLLRN